MNKEKLEQLLESLRKQIPADVMEKLKTAKGDVDFCRILAENGIDVENFEKQVKESGVDFGQIGVVMDSDELAQVAGGWTKEISSGSYYVEYKCPYCGNGDRDRHSYQFWASLGSELWALGNGGGDIYRCKNCGHYWEMRHGMINRRDDYDVNPGD